MATNKSELLGREFVTDLLERQLDVRRIPLLKERAVDRKASHSIRNHA